MRINRLVFEPGQVVDLVASGDGNPPDRQSGRHANRPTLWARVAPDGPWRRVQGIGSMERAMDGILDCAGAADAMALLCGPAATSGDGG